MIVAASITGFSPFFSPDSQWLAYFMENALYRAAVSRGVPERLAPVPRVLRKVHGRTTVRSLCRQTSESMF